jgi:hypothetical protein
MKTDAIPLWVIFLGTIVLIVIAIEAGHYLGKISKRRTWNENETSVSTLAAAILGLLAFMLAFTFGIVTDRFESRKELVRNETNVIRTAWMRADFLPEPDRVEAKRLLLEYVELRLSIIKTFDRTQLLKVLERSVQIQEKLWDRAVENARMDMNSDVAALYIESVNEIVSMHSLRVTVGLQTRIPTGIWVVLYMLIILGMIAVGYQTTISSSRSPWLTPIMALSFTLVIGLIFTLDRPESGFFPVSHQSLSDLLDFMRAAL